jgi:hypothetical protein
MKISNRLFFILLSPALLAFTGCYLPDHTPGEMVTVNDSRPLGREKALDSQVNFPIGSLEITGENKTQSLYSYDLEYDKNSYRPEIHYNESPGGEEGRLSFRLENNDEYILRGQHQNTRLRLAFNNSIPLKLRIESGVGNARLSLSGLKISRLNLTSGVGGAKISAYDPNPISCELLSIETGVGAIEAVGLGNMNFRNLEFEGGVGSAKLDFSGEWKQDANIRLQIGVGGVKVSLPRELGVKVEAEKHLLSGLHLDGFSQQNSSYYSENYNRAKIRVFINVVTGVGEFRIAWI